MRGRTTHCTMLGSALKLSPRMTTATPPSVVKVVALPLMATDSMTGFAKLVVGELEYKPPTTICQLRFLPAAAGMMQRSCRCSWTNEQDVGVKSVWPAGRPDVEGTTPSESRGTLSVLPKDTCTAVRSGPKFVPARAEQASDRQQTRRCGGLGIVMYHAGTNALTHAP